jgi:hypothetical protein
MEVTGLMRSVRGYPSPTRDLLVVLLGAVVVG